MVQILEQAAPEQQQIIKCIHLLEYLFSDVCHHNQALFFEALQRTLNETKYPAQSEFKNLVKKTDSQVHITVQQLVYCL